MEAGIVCQGKLVYKDYQDKDLYSGIFKKISLLIYTSK